MNLGLEMVRFSKGKTVKAHQILAAGPRGTLFVETALITLAHLALASEEIEIEVPNNGPLIIVQLHFLIS